MATCFSGSLKIFFVIFAHPKREKGQNWFLGRVVRQRSAKPCTAVRIRQEPQIMRRLLD
jgi:hypothetical protein